VREAALRQHPELGDFEVYASGPPPMIEALRNTYPAHGLNPERLFFDSFEFAADAE